MFTTCTRFIQLYEMKANLLSLHHVIGSAAECCRKIELPLRFPLDKRQTFVGPLNPPGERSSWLTCYCMQDGFRVLFLLLTACLYVKMHVSTVAALSPHACLPSRLCKTKTVRVMILVTGIWACAGKVPYALLYDTSIFVYCKKWVTAGIVQVWCQRSSN